MTTSRSQKHNYVIIEPQCHSNTHTWAFLVPGRKIFIMITIYSQILYLSLLFQLCLTCIVECWKTWIFTLPSPPYLSLILLHSLPWYSFVYFSHAFVFLFISLCYRAVFYEKCRYTLEKITSSWSWFKSQC